MSIESLKQTLAKNNPIYALTQEIMGNGEESPKQVLPVGEISILDINGSQDLVHADMMGMWEGIEIQSIVHPVHGRIWKAKTLAETIDVKWCGETTIGHVPDEFKLLGLNPTSFGDKKTWFLTQDGVNFFLARSRSKKALPFQIWLSKVLTDIQNTGAHISKSITSDQLKAVSNQIAELMNRVKKSEEAFWNERREKLDIIKDRDTQVKVLVKVVTYMEKIRPLSEEGAISEKTGRPKDVLQRASFKSSPIRKSVAVVSSEVAI